MALNHYTLTVGTTPVRLAVAPSGVDECRVYITNHDNAALYIGDESVATSGADWGFTIVKDASYEFVLAAGDAIYAISATSAQTTVLILSS
jgi:hypothetical protein